MKIKMTPLHGHFATTGAKTPHHYEDFKIPLKDDAEKKSHLAIHEGNKQGETAQTPMSKRSIKEDGYAGKSTPKGCSGEESKAPKTAKPMA